MKELVGIAEQIAEKLIARKQTIAVAESSTGGLISAALLSVAGASAYFRGGSVIYTQYARSGFLEIPNPLPNKFIKSFRSSILPIRLRRYLSC